MVSIFSCQVQTALASHRQVTKSLPISHFKKERFKAWCKQMQMVSDLKAETTRKVFMAHCLKTKTQKAFVQWLASQAHFKNPVWYMRCLYKLTRSLEVCRKRSRGWKMGSNEFWFFRVSSPTGQQGRLPVSHLSILHPAQCLLRSWCSAN